jgi:hypothetical protein
MRHFLTRLSGLAIVTALALAFVAGAEAAWAQGASPPYAAWRTMDVTLLDSPQAADPLMIVSGELPADTPLPAEIAVPMPPRAQIQWAGEILGGDVSKDPEAKPRVESGSGYDLAVYTLRRARAAQVEAVAAGAASTSGSKRTANLDWTSPIPVPQVTISIRVPIGSKVPKAPAGSSRRAAQDGTVQYVRTYKSVEAGQRLSMQLVYEPPAPAAGTGAPGAPQAPGGPTAPAPGQGSGLAAWAPWLLAIAIAAAVYLWVNGRKSARGKVEDELEEDEMEEVEFEEAEPEPKPKPKPRAARKPAAKSKAKPKPKPKAEPPEAPGPSEAPEPPDDYFPDEVAD